MKEAVRPVKVRTPGPDFRNTRPEQFSLNLGYRYPAFFPRLGCGVPGAHLFDRPHSSNAAAIGFDPGVHVGNTRHDLIGKVFPAGALARKSV